MQRRRIGRTGLDVTEIGFGGAPIGDLTRMPSDAEAQQLLQNCWDAGIRYFDTAPFYGSGLSERRIGDFLRDKPREEFVISTKVGRLLVPDRDWAMERYGNRRQPPFRPVFDYSYDGIMRSYELSIQRLGLERIDILYLHDIGRFSQSERHEAQLQIALAGGVKALQQLRETGAVSAIGVGVNEWEILDELMDHAQWDVFLLASRYTLLEQVPLETFLPRCEREGVSIVIGGPLSTGILGSGTFPGVKYNYAPAPPEIIDRVDAIDAACRAEGVVMAAAALQFPLAHTAIAAVLPGFASLADFEKNIRHFATQLPTTLWERLKREGLLEARAPVPSGPVL
ncbi:MAG: pld1 2 [Devosia sp.]|nr:pld1 2 [Devosia sp.]